MYFKKLFSIACDEEITSKGTQSALKVQQQLLPRKPKNNSKFRNQRKIR